MVMEKLFLSSKLIAFSPLFFSRLSWRRWVRYVWWLGKVCKIVLKKKSYPTQPKKPQISLQTQKQNFTRDAYLQIHLNMYWLVWGSWDYLSEAEYAKQRMVKPSLECRQYHMLALALVQTNKHLNFSRSERKESVVNMEVFFYTTQLWDFHCHNCTSLTKPGHVGFDFVSGHFCPP